jgi:hypothetical protein
MKTQYGIYTIDEYPEQNGRWGGYKTSVMDSVGKQGKLYLQSDGRENYKAKDDELEI